MKRVSAAGFVAGLLLIGGCSSQRQVSTMRDVPAPVDDTDLPMGPMPLAVGDSVGRSVFMNRSALIARGLVPTDRAFADGSMSQLHGD